MKTWPYDTQVPTINQENAIPGSEPTETLKKFRSDKVLRPARKQQGKVWLQFIYYHYPLYSCVL